MELQRCFFCLTPPQFIEVIHWRYTDIYKSWYIYLHLPHMSQSEKKKKNMWEDRVRDSHCGCSNILFVHNDRHSSRLSVFSASGGRVIISENSPESLLWSGYKVRAAPFRLFLGHYCLFHLQQNGTFPGSGTGLDFVQNIFFQKIGSERDGTEDREDTGLQSKHDAPHLERRTKWETLTLW